MHRIALAAFVVFCVGLIGCPRPGDGDSPDSGSSAGGAGGGGGGGSSQQDAGRGNPVPGVELMTRFAGLWSGPATQTPLGSFPTMNVDMRNATPEFLYGRTDLDAQNSLRFGFAIETYDGGNVLAYRNGGFFQGVLRDTRTKLIASDADAGTYQFCEVNQGCGYLSALLTFTSPTALIFDVKVRNAQHVYWMPTRVETRTVPTEFPATFHSTGNGANPWPALPALAVTVNWQTALAAPADVWIILTSTTCAPTFGCRVSRSLRTNALAGATTAQLTVSDMHGGPYFLSAIVDRNNDFSATLRPNTGDLLAVDVPVTVAAPTTSVTASATYTVP